MNTKTRIYLAALLCGTFVTAFPRSLPAQSTGSIEFTARVAATGGRPEPVRQLTFYLLRKSLEDIRTDALQASPLPELDKFIDGLEATPELKSWMKKHHSVQLSGEDFTKSLTPDDIVGVPEFFKAYMTRNAGFRGVGFPNPKFKEKDRDSNPEKYKQEKEEYLASVRKFILVTPESVQGIDVDLIDIDPSPKWTTLVTKQRRAWDSHAAQLAQDRYVVAQTDSDLDGQGYFARIAPGTYWIGMLGEQAISGDVRLRWDFPVTVRAGETAHVELSNVNAVKTDTAAQNSDH